jgi:hypothetical protein
MALQHVAAQASCMPTAAQPHRSAWLRRTRAITGWIAALAATATLLIAAVVGSASTTEKVINHVEQRPRVPAAQPARSVRVVHRTRLHHHVRKPRVTPTTTPVAPAPTPPAPAPAVTPVAVSGGS